MLISVIDIFNEESRKKIVLLSELHQLFLDKQFSIYNSNSKKREEKYIVLMLHDYRVSIWYTPYTNISVYYDDKLQDTVYKEDFAGPLFKLYFWLIVKEIEIYAKKQNK